MRRYELTDEQWERIEKLPRLYERQDWQARFTASKNEEPLLLERGVSVNVQSTFTQPDPPKSSEKGNPDIFAEAAKERMAEARAGKSPKRQYKADDERYSHHEAAANRQFAEGE